MIDQTKIQCSICGAWYLYNGFGAKKTCFCVEDNNDQPKSEVSVDKHVSPESTDIEKQENIVTILYEFIDNMILDDAFKDYLKGYSTHGIRKAVGTALEKILKLDNLKVMDVQ